MSDVLLVESEQKDREFYRHNLIAAGHTVQLVGDGRSALQQVRRRRPDVVVLEMRLPGMNGLDVIEHLLQMDPSLPIIIHTRDRSYEEMFMSWAADEYLLKSSDLSSLETAIQKVVRSRSGTTQRLPSRPERTKARSTYIHKPSLSALAATT